MPENSQLKIIVEHDGVRSSVVYGHPSAAVWREMKESTGLSDTKLIRLAIGSLHTRLLAETKDIQVLLRHTKTGSERVWPLPGQLYKPYENKRTIPP